MTRFGVGDRVVCVDDTFPSYVGPLFTTVPCLNGIYTIRAVGAWTGAEGGVGVALVGIHGRPNANPENPLGEHCFRSERFRPLVEKKRKTDIGVFQHMLTERVVEVVD